MCPFIGVLVPRGYSSSGRLVCVGLTRRSIDRLHRTVTVAISSTRTPHGQHLIGPPKTEAATRAVVLPSELVAEIEDHPAEWAEPGPDGLVFIGAKGTRSGLRSARPSGTGPGAASGWPISTSTICATSPGTLAAATGAGAKELMYRSATSRHRPRCATSTRPVNAARPSPRRWGR